MFFICCLFGGKGSESLCEGIVQTKKKTMAVSSVVEPVRFWPAPGIFSPAPAPAPKKRLSTN